MTHRCAQNLYPLLAKRVLWDPLLQPPSAKRHMPPACGVLCSKHVSFLHGLGSCSGYTTLPGRNLQSANSVVSTQNTRRPKNEQLLIRVESSLNRFQRCVLPHTEEKRHEGVPFPPSPWWMVCTLPSSTSPETSGWRRIWCFFHDGTDGNNQ